MADKIINNVVVDNETAKFYAPNVLTGLEETEAVSELKENLNEISDIKTTSETINTAQTLTVNENAYYWNGEYSSTSYGYVHITGLQKGDIITAHASSVDTTLRAWRFTDAYVGTTRNASASVDGSINTLTIPAGVDNVYLSMESRWVNDAVFYVLRTTETIERTPKGYNDLMDIVDISTYTNIEVTDIHNVTWTTGFSEPSNGRIYTGGSYDSYAYSNRIKVKQGDVISCYNNANAVSQMRTVTAFNQGVANTTAGSSDNSSSFVVLENTDEIVITTIEPATGKYIRVESVSEKTGATLKKNNSGFFRSEGDVSDGEYIALPVNDVKLENVISFSGRINTFNSLKIGKNVGAYPYIVIDATNITLNNGSNTVAVAHGLTIENDIQVNLFQNSGISIVKIILCSSGEEFIYTTPFLWEIAVRGSYYAQSIGSSLTGCALSWTNKNIDAPIWIFGDSYLSMSDPSRWPYYAVRDELTKSTMFNAFAGEGSIDAYWSLYNLLKCRIPKVVVWALGMNDGDSESAVNATWKTYYNRVVDLSKKYGFELVLYTVPTCPAVNNNFKNAIVKASGYRYIDADGAVRISGTDNWISDTLNPDNTHPTVKGAKIIYHRVLADLPEMCNNN